MIETTLGGLKFPDGTVQTTSAAGALFSVAHDTTLQGNGTSGSPLGVAIPLFFIGSQPNSALIVVENTGEMGSGVLAFGRNGGDAVKPQVAVRLSEPTAIGVTAQGGDGTGGIGILAFGGSASASDNTVHL